MLALLVFSMGIPTMGQNSFYDFTVEDIHGKEYDLAQLQGKKVLVVNTASKCAFTPQYRGLESLYREYGGEDFVILGFPSNDFRRQEPGTNAEIATFCSTKYNVSFPMMAKISVKGEQMHPLYLWLTSASENGVEDSKVTWNFQKYMIDEAGILVGHLPPQKKPESKKIIAWLTE
ncbi:MAG: glutathione peroxidase [Bacteroidales bacterium]|nr:glutathione peroxidase [Bacteroidales bacterium]